MSLNLGKLFGSMEMDIGPLEGAITQATDKVKGFGAKGAALAATGGALIGASLAAGVFGAMDIQAANAKLAAQLGLSKDDAAKYGKLAGQVYAGNYGESIGAVNNAIRSIKLNLTSVNDVDLAAVTKNVLSIADAFDEDSDAITTAASTLVNSGLAANAQDALDIVTVGLQSNANKAGDVVDSINEYSATVSKLGLSGAQMMGLMSQAVTAGARDGDKAGDVLHELVRQVTEGGAGAVTALEHMGLSVKDVQTAFAEGGPKAAGFTDLILDKLRELPPGVKRSTDAIGLFGDMAGEMGDALYALDPSKAVDALNKVEGAAQKVNDTMGSTGAANLEAFKRQAKMVFEDVIGGRVIPIVTQVATTLSTQFGPAVDAVAGVMGNTLVPAAQAVSQFIGAHETTFRIVGGVIAAVLVPALVGLALQATASAVRVVAGWVVQAMWAASSAVATVTSVATQVGAWILLGAQSLMAGARVAAAWLIAIGPIAIVIAAVAGVVVLIVKNWDTVKAATKAAFDAVVGAVKWAVGMVLDVIKTYIGLWVSAIKGVGAVVGIVVGFFANLVSGIRDKVGDVVGVIKAMPGKAISAIGNLGSSLLGKGTDFIQGFIDGIIDKAAAIPGVIKDKVVGVAKSALHGFGLFGSPSRLTHQYGAWWTEGFVKGMDARGPALTSAAAGMVARLQLPEGSAPRLSVTGFAAPSIDLGGAQGVRGGDGASAAVHIEHYHEREGADARATAEELYLLTKARG